MSQLVWLEGKHTDQKKHIVQWNDFQDNMKHGIRILGKETNFTLKRSGTEMYT